MKQIISKRLSIVFVSILLTSASVIWACSWFEEYDWYTSIFAPESIASKGYEPMYRSSFSFYKTDWIGSHVADFDSINIVEWSGYFQGKVSNEDLQYYLYKARIGEVDTAIFAVKSTKFKAPARVRNSSLLKYSNPVATKDFLYYLGYAKRCEPFATYVPDYWSDENEDPLEDGEAIQKLIDGGLKQLTNASDAFIRERYLFQIIRLSYLIGGYENCETLYHQNKALITNTTTMGARINGYRAASYYKQGDYANANYLYAQIFNQCEAMRISAFQSFHPMEDADWNATLNLAQNPHEKMILWQMLGIYADPLRAMTEIYKIDPKSDLIELLLARAINIEEEKVFSEPYNNANQENNQNIVKSSELDKNLLKFVLQVDKNSNTHQPELWKLSAGYLQILAGQNKTGEKVLNDIANNSKVSLLYREQARLMLLVSFIEQLKKIDATAESKLLAEMKWLYETKHDADFRDRFANEWVTKRLAEKYAMDGNLLKAQLLDNYRNPKFYLTDENGDKMLAFMNSPSLSPYEKYIVARYPLKPAAIVDFQAIQLALRHQLKEALAKLNEIEGLGNETLPGDPFLIHIKDCHDCDHSAEQPVSYTQKEFLEKMLEYEQLAISQPNEAAHYYYFMANGYYNMTYFGNARAMYYSDVYDRYSASIAYDADPMDPMYDCSMAETYYNKALIASKNKEFKAQCCFMASKCELNNYFLNGTHEDNVDFRAGKYFSDLEKNYSNTQYFNEIVNECGYFRTYITR